MKLAGHLKRDPKKLKKEKTVSELTLWDEFFKLEWTDPDVHCWYMAQIAHQIYLLRSSLPFTGFKPDAKFEDFLLKFDFTPKKKEIRMVRGIPVAMSIDGRVITEERMKKIEAKKSQLEAIISTQAKRDKVKKPILPAPKKPKADKRSRGI